MKYYVRTTGIRKLDPSFTQLTYQLITDANQQFDVIFADMLLQICDDDVVLLEDDIVLCREFDAKIHEVIAARPHDIINFFTQPFSYITSGYSDKFSYNQCTYYPKEKLRVIGEYIQNNYSDLCATPLRLNYPKPSVEYLIRCALLDLNYSHYIYRPCLVQHLDFRSLIGYNLPVRRRTPYFIDYIEDLNLTYEECADTNNRQQLYQYMRKQFRAIDKRYRDLYRAK